MRSEIRRVGKEPLHRCCELYEEKQNTYLNIIIYSQTSLCYYKPEQSDKEGTVLHVFV
jgi:hypothetical protein